MSDERSYLVPNLVIVSRVLLAFVVVAMLSTGEGATAWAGVGLIVVVIVMDGLDGFLARRLDLESELGGVLDITADRIVEHIFWISFAVFGLVGLWVPLVVMTRSFLVDTARGLALAHGKSAFGSDGMMRSPVSRFLTGSRFMRNLYGVAKVGAFVLLGAMMAVGSGGDAVTPLGRVASVATWVVVVLCVLRGIPVLLDVRAYLEPADA